MTTITIPRATVKDKELVAIPRKEYENYLRLRKVIPVIKKKRISAYKTFKPTKAELKELKEARDEYRRGKTMTLYELRQKLGFRS